MFKSTSKALCLCCLVLNAVAAAPISPTLTKATWHDLQQIKAHKTIPLTQLPRIHDAVWNKYAQAQSTQPDRKMENEQSAISFNGKTMRYTKKVIGKRPPDGYPLYIALHGGGGGPARMNDGQYNHMKVYYRDSIKNGVYVAVRGVTNTWNLHFVNESYPLYDRLIENAILFDGVDPNRVYIMGFSAGGDGVYQLAPRMADRWGAASMSAGHHNGVSPKNLLNVPFLFQVGEKDAAYKRNTVAVDFLKKLENFQAPHPKGFKHLLNIHYNRGHNFLDNHPKRPKQAVISAPHAWRDKQNRQTHEQNTNAVDWLSQHARNPLPTKVIWDLKTTAPREAAALWDTKTHGKRHYWLSSGDAAPAKLGTSIVASCSPGSNQIKIKTDAATLDVMLSNKMIDFTKPLRLSVNGSEQSISAIPRLATMVQTVTERGDPNYIFDAVIRLNQVNGAWQTNQIP